DPILRMGPRFVLASLGLPILRMGPRFVLALLGLPILRMGPRFRDLSAGEAAARRMRECQRGTH
ncbi:MAG: hypothetical protein J7M32_07275, partial [Deltaproteobacteria bacterium]|nr:hypothetical protein [Deltaproteobacteria bacterium]